MTSDYVKILIPSLLENKFKVSSSMGSGKLFLSNGISNCIPLTLEGEVVSKDLTDLAKEICRILKQCKMYYYGFSLLRGVDMLYNIGNIDGATDITRVMKMKALW